MLSFRPKGGISDSGNDRDVSTSRRFVTPLESLRERPDRTTFINVHLLIPLFHLA